MENRETDRGRDRHTTTDTQGQTDREGQTGKRQTGQTQDADRQDANRTPVSVLQQKTVVQNLVFELSACVRNADDLDRLFSEFMLVAEAMVPLRRHQQMTPSIS